MIKLLILLTISFNLFANQLTYFVNNFDTLTAEFIQIIDGKEEKGELQVDKVNKKIKFKTYTPYEKNIILNNNKIASYDVAIRVANIIEYEPHNLIEFLLGNNIEEIVDLGENYFYKGYLFYFANNKLNKIINTNTQDEIIFTKLVINPKINQNEFKFIFPSDVDVIDGT